MDRKWTAAIFVVIGIVLMSAYDIDQNYQNLGSLTGGMAFTYCGSLFGFFVSRHPVTATLGAVLCVVISANMNVSNKLNPNAAQESIRALESELRGQLYTEQQIMDCYNDLPRPCRSNVLIDHNELIKSELSLLMSKKDSSWRPMTDREKQLAVVQAATVPFSLALLTILLGSIFQRDGIKKVKKRFEWNLKGFKKPFNGFKKDLNDIEIKKNVLKGHERDVLARLYSDMSMELKREVKQSELRAEIRRQGIPNLSGHNKIKFWWDNCRQEVYIDNSKALTVEKYQGQTH